MGAGGCLFPRQQVATGIPQLEGEHMAEQGGKVAARGGNLT